MDLHGPIEMLGMMENVDIKLVGDKQIIKSRQGPKIVTDLSTKEITPCDLFVVPGG